MSTKFSDLFDGELVSDLQESGCQILAQAGYHNSQPVDSVYFARCRVREVAYVPTTAANAIAIIVTANITVNHIYVSYGPSRTFLPTDITARQRMIYIALLILLAPFATAVMVGWLIWVGLTFYSQSKAVVIVQLADGSYLQVARLDE